MAAFHTAYTKNFSKRLYKSGIMWYNKFTVYLDRGMTSIFTPVYVSGIFLLRGASNVIEG